MRLKHIPENEKLIKHSLKIQESESEKIAQYSEYVLETTGKKISNEEVMVSMIKTFLDEDKKFQTWLRKKPKESAQEKTQAPPQLENSFN